jgi:hypothetical protein
MVDLAVIQEKMKAISTAHSDYARSAFEANKAYVEQLAAMRAPDEAMQLMIGHTKSSYETFVAEAAKIGEMYRDLFSLTIGTMPNTPTLRVVS